MCHTLHTTTMHQTASLANDGNSAYCQDTTLNTKKTIEVSIESSPQQ